MDEVRYSIKDLEHFTKIKAHTIRIWEQRYKLLDPKRTETNIRYYNEEDLKKILNINLLYNSGFKISKIASLTEPEITDAAKDLIYNGSSENDPEINAIIVDIMAFEGEEINKRLEKTLSSGGIDQLYNTLIKPVLIKLGELWQVNSIDIVHEHYFSNIYKQFLISQIQSIDVKPKGNKKALLFLHDDEEHEFSILLSYYMLKKAGYNCYYFGQRVPVKELSSVVSSIEPNIILTHFTSKLSDKRYKMIEEELVKLSNGAKVVISGAQLNNFSFKTSPKLISVSSIEDLKGLLK